MDSQTHQPQPRVRRRNRLITSCLECRRRKLKCDKRQPCSNCVKTARQCVFIATDLSTDVQAKLADVKEKMGILERSLEAGVTKGDRANACSASANERMLPLGQDQSLDHEDDEDVKDLKSSHLTLDDAAYHEEGDDDDSVDHGIVMGKLKITERIGGLVRPRFSEELSQALKELPPSKSSQWSEYFKYDYERLVEHAVDRTAPSPSFYFAPGLEKTSFMAHLPSRILVDRLIVHYWQAVHVIATTVHRPSFERQYQQFWLNIEAGIEPRKSFQAVLFAALMSAVISMPEAKVANDFNVDKASLVHNFREGTEAALARSKFLRTTKLETLQAFVMYLVPLCCGDVTRAHSALTGTCIRLAEIMGLHRDPIMYNMSPVEVQIRRILWHQICFLDFRTCEATGPRPQIRPDDYDTKLPLNVDDDELERAQLGHEKSYPETDQPSFTSITITRMRFECYEMHRFLWYERLKLEKRKENGEREVTITSLLSRVQSFKAAMGKKFLPMLGKSIPLHSLASELYGIMTDKMYVLLLQKYLSSDRRKMPDRLRQIIIGAAVMLLEHSMNIEQQPLLTAWSWYIGALHQYHVALLLVSELYAAPREPMLEQRVWKVLEYAFELPSSMPTIEKIRVILTVLAQKSESHASMKGIRAPADMPHAGPRTHTPGYQARQKEAQEKQETGGSSPSFDDTAGSWSEQLSSNHLPRVEARPNTGSLLSSTASSSPPPMDFPGAIPNTDWGFLSTPKSTPLTQHSSQQYTQNFGDPLSVSKTNTTTTQGSSIADLSPLVQDNISLFTSGSSPLDIMEDIEWNAFNQMFGDAAMETDTMLVPPFTFPPISLSDIPDMNS